MTATFRTRRLDARFTGSNHFTHMVDYKGNIKDRMTLFLHQRRWCWETFGPSSELNFYSLMLDMDELPEWAWQTEHNQIRLYFNEKQLAWFKIKWS